MFEFQVNTETPKEIQDVMVNMSKFEGSFNTEKTGFDAEIHGHSTNIHMTLRQQPRTVKQEGTGTRLEFGVRKEMALMLDDHLCTFTVALHQYNKHYWISEGAESFSSLNDLFRVQRDTTQKHIDIMGKRISRLGGVPTSHPETQHELSYVKHEVEGRYSVRDFVRNDLEMELKIQDMLTKQIARANEIKDYGTVNILEQILSEREEIGHKFYSLLEDDTLVRGMKHLLDETKPTFKEDWGNTASSTIQ